MTGVSDTVIRVENLGKKYIIGHQTQGRSRYTALRDVLADGAKSVGRRIFNPFAQQPLSPTKEEFWALKDVSFEIKQGDRVGIIGRNGAGKSTLLKLLSRITEPTTGRICVKGRVASLLEVGTGFHPELTGRENIYLNGAILGMSKAEIKKKFDEIVNFAEVEKFLDTPVKHYSSGMYVRLAFAVAAHLESEILIVDEVLAVGDTQFQRKCLGKMEKIGNSGRTILFVSHNMAAIRILCNRGISIEKGALAFQADIETVISHHLLENSKDVVEGLIAWNPEEAPQSPEIRFTKAYILNHEGEYTSLLDCRKGFHIVIEYEIRRPLKGLRIGFYMQNSEAVPICGSNDPDAWPQIVRESGYYKSECFFPGYTLNTGQYSMYFGADIPPNPTPLVSTAYCLSFTVEDVEGHGEFHEKLPGIIRPNLTWKIQQSSNQNGRTIFA